MSILQHMTMWLPDLEGRKGPVYRAIADAIDEGVQNGTLRAGTRLPPHRDLADHLGVTFIRNAEAEEANGDGGLLDLSINVLMPDKEVANLAPHLFQRRVLPWTQ